MLRFGIILLLLALPGLSQAGWRLDAAASSLHYTTIKNGGIAENNRFSGLTASLDQAGQFVLRIDLASVDTGIAIRDERMRVILFEVERYPQAEVLAEVPADVWQTTDTGRPVPIELPIRLRLHGFDAEYQLQVTVTRIDEVTLLVNAREPVLVQAADFGLLDGLAQLQAMAGLQHISPVVPVGFSLLFRHD